jgi:hypothetical protein
MRLILTFVFLGALITGVLTITGIATILISDSKNIKKEVVLTSVYLLAFIILTLGYTLPVNHYKTAIKNSIKAEYGNVYEYDYCYLLDTGSFTYDNNYYDIETTKDIDNNTYVKVTKENNNSNAEKESLNLPIKKN